MPKMIAHCFLMAYERDLFLFCILDTVKIPAKPSEEALNLLRGDLFLGDDPFPARILECTEDILCNVRLCENSSRSFTRPKFSARLRFDWMWSTIAAEEELGIPGDHSPE